MRITHNPFQSCDLGGKLTMARVKTINMRFREPAGLGAELWKIRSCGMPYVSKLGYLHKTVHIVVVCCKHWNEKAGVQNRILASIAINATQSECPPHMLCEEGQFARIFWS